MKLINREPTPEMLSIISNEKEVFHSAESLYAALYDAAPEVKYEPVEIDWPEYHCEAMDCGLEDWNITDRYATMRYGWDEAIERCVESIPENLFEFPPNAQAEIARLNDLIEEQKGTITALNMALGGEDSTSTENLIDAHEVDSADEGLIALCRNLTKENVRLEDVVLFQKKAWTSDFEELETLKDQLASSESSPITEEVEDILRSEITKRDARIAELQEQVDLQIPRQAFEQQAARIKELESFQEWLNEHCSQGWDKVDEQAAEISRMKSELQDLHKRNYVTHSLFETGDADCPEQAKDRNGEVVLGVCKNCGRIEAELAEPCDHRKEIARLKAVIGKCEKALIESRDDVSNELDECKLRGANGSVRSQTEQLARHDEALAAIKELEYDTTD